MDALVAELDGQCRAVTAGDLSRGYADGLRAQAQCRATWETLSAMKNPSSVAFVRQANIAHGPQQVNNSIPEPSRARENEIAPNRLLEMSDGERLDTGAASATGGADPSLQAVGAVHRAEDGRGEG